MNVKSVFLTLLLMGITSQPSFAQERKFHIGDITVDSNFLIPHKETESERHAQELVRNADKLFHQRKFDEAMLAYETALTLDGSVLVIYSLTSIYETKKLWGRELQLYDFYFSTRNVGDAYKLKIKYAWLLAKHNRFVESKMYLGNAMAIRKDSEDFILKFNPKIDQKTIYSGSQLQAITETILGMDNLLIGKYLDAEKYLSSAVLLNPRLPAAHFYLGVVQREIPKKKTEAEKHLQEALRIGDSDVRKAVSLVTVK